MKKLPKILDNDWMTLTIDTLVGPRLMMLAASEPQKAAALADILKDAITCMYKEDKRRWAKDPDQFIYAVKNLCGELVSTFTIHLLSKRLRDGPRKPIIIAAPTKYPSHLKPM